MKALILCRVSSKVQEETGYSLPAQKKVLSTYADSKGFSVLKVFAISETASKPQARKIYNEMLKYTRQNGIDIICCEKIDRLVRNLKDAAIIDDWIKEKENRQVHFYKESFILHKNTPAHENLVWDMKVAISRFYTNNLSEEVRKGQKEKLSQGWIPSRAKIGYKTVGQKGHKTHCMDAEKAPYIKRAFELYDSGNYSTPALSDVLYKEGLRNKFDKKVGKSRIYDILIDPFYCGKIRWNGVLYEGKHTPIVSKALFKSVQERLNRQYTNPQFKKHFPLFKAKMFCGGCNGTVTWETQKGHWYGHCNHYKKCDQNTWWRQEKAESSISSYLYTLRIDNLEIIDFMEKPFLELHQTEVTYTSYKKAEIQKKLEIAERRLEAIYEDKIDGNISLELYTSKYTKYSKDKEEALYELERLQESNEKYYMAGIALHRLAARAFDIFQTPKANTDDRRLLLSKIFSNLLLNACDIKANYSLAFKFLCQWIPEVNDTFEPKKLLAKYRQSSFSGGNLPVLLAWQESFRTFSWKEAIPDPEKEIREIEYLLSLVAETTTRQVE